MDMGQARCYNKCNDFYEIDFSYDFSLNRDWISFFHGFSIGVKPYSLFLRELSKRYSIVAPNIFGINGFKHQPRNRDQYLDLALSFLNSFSSIIGEENYCPNPKFLVGHSLGATIAISASKYINLEGVVAINPIMPTNYGSGEMMARGIEVGLNAFGKKKNGFKLSFVPGYLSNLIKNPLILRRIISDLNKYNFDSSSGESLEITTPTLIIFSKRDQLFGNSLTKAVRNQMDEIFKAGYELIINNCQHDFPMADPKRAGELCLNWMRKII